MGCGLRAWFLAQLYLEAVLHSWLRAGGLGVFLCGGRHLGLFWLVGAGASFPLLSLPGMDWCFSFVPDLVIGVQRSPSSGSFLNL